MALIVEDGTGLSNAESLGSVAEADAYHAAYGNTAWAALSTGQKELSLRLGMRWMLVTYAGRWKAPRMLDSQALPFPQSGGTYPDGYTLEDGVIPEAVKRAQFEAALVCSTNEDMLPDVEIEDSGAVQSESVTLGPISVSTGYAGGRSTEKQYTKAYGWLKGWVLAGGTAVPG